MAVEKNEDGTISLKDLVNEYSACKVDAQKNIVLEKLLTVKTYISYYTKQKVAESLVKSICVKEDNLTFECNSSERYMAMIMSIISLYTNIEVEGSSKDYDLLKESGLMDVILERANEKKDIDEYLTVWEMEYGDLREKYQSFDAVVSNNVKRFGLLCNVGLYKLGDSIENMSEGTLKNVLEKYAPVLEKALSQKE